MLRFDHITVCRQGKTVLKDISFALSPNRLTVVLGKNGSGKTTLVSCVTGQVRYQGDIYYRDSSLRRMPARERAKQIALLPQILPSAAMSVEKLVRLGRSPYLDLIGRLSDTDVRRVDQALATVGMTEFRDKPLDQLSGGERQKAYLAMILAQDTQVVILDEPTTYMDAQNKNELMSLLDRLKTEYHKTVLVVLHDLTCAAEIADDLLILHEDGSKAFSGSKEECLQSGMIEKTFQVHRSSYEKDGKQFPLYY